MFHYHDIALYKYLSVALLLFIVLFFFFPENIYHTINWFHAMASSCLIHRPFHQIQTYSNWFRFWFIQFILFSIFFSSSFFPHIYVHLVLPKQNEKKLRQKWKIKFSKIRIDIACAALCIDNIALKCSVVFCFWGMLHTR